jgi:hypothetical protein
MNTRVSDLIKRAGGPDVISDASKDTTHPIGPDAVHKWRKNGIPDVHWPIFIRKASATIEEIYRANEILRESRSDPVEAGRRRRSRVAA